MTDPFRLPQTFILPRDLGFGHIRAAIERLGFAPVATGVQSAPLIDGEPEFAAWARPGGVPMIHYSFNPVVRLRVLDVGETPPRLRGMLAEALTPVTAAEVRAALASGDDRMRLFAVWAALETERLDLAHDIGVLAETAHGALRDEAEAAAFKLGDLAAQRLETLAGARLIAAAAVDRIASFMDADVVAAHLPRASDCHALFVPQIAGQVAEAVARASWPGRGIAARPQGPDDVTASPAGAFRAPNEISDRFPMGYRTIAGWMEPSCIWIGWTGREPDGGQVQMDGLAFCEGRWVFFPKPFRIVERLLPALPDPLRPRSG